jgi:hypothetical protein
LPLDAYTLLLFLAGLLAGIGLCLTCYAGYEHVQIVRFLQAQRRTSDGDGDSTPRHADRERHAS